MLSLNISVIRNELQLDSETILLFTVPSPSTHITRLQKPSLMLVIRRSLQTNRTLLKLYLRSILL